MGQGPTKTATSRATRSPTSTSFCTASTRLRRARRSSTSTARWRGIGSRSIDDVLCWPVGGFLKALGPPDQVRRFDPVTHTFLDYERLCAEMETARLTPSVPRVVEFLTQDPGRQYVTGSFHPDDSDWYAQAYGEK